MRNFLFLTWLLSTLCLAQGQYLSTEQFLDKAFNSHTLASQVLWLTADSKAVAETILQHPVNALRIRYWQQGARSAWILHEIGKEKPITIGVVVENDAIVSVDILAFRESRGWEIRHDFFTEQFNGAGLVQDKNHYRLSSHIDGITGATLSVSAVKRAALLALFLHRQLDQHGEP